MAIKLTARVTKWFNLPQDPTGEAMVEIVHLKPGQLSEIEKKVNRIIGKQVENGEFVTEIDVNVPLRMQEIIRAAIVNWKGFDDEMGKPMKCTDKNKLKVLGNFDWFYAQIEEFREQLADEVSADEEEVEKN